MGVYPSNCSVCDHSFAWFSGGPLICNSCWTGNNGSESDKLKEKVEDLTKENQKLKKVIEKVQDFVYYAKEYEHLVDSSSYSKKLKDLIDSLQKK